MVDGTRGSHSKVGSTKMTDISTATAGVDVSKLSLDAAVFESNLHWKVTNDRQGWQALVERLRRAGVCRVGLEATGRYSRPVIAHLRASGFEVIVHQPLQVKAFARARLQRAKNDRLDAMLIATFTALIDWPERLKADERLTGLADLLVFIEQAEEDLMRAKTRLEHQQEPRLRRLLEADVRRAKQRRDRELARLERALRQHEDLAERLDLVQSVPGIGLRTAVALVVGMPELGSISREEAASLAGLAPFDHDSGKKTGQRCIVGGRLRVRTSLYAAALPAAFRWNPELGTFYRRLTAAGKTHKVALVACARKLLIYANTVLQRRTPWVSQP